MIIGKIWRSIAAQFNKLANFFWTSDPIAQMQYEYDQAIEQLKGGREGLSQYRALVERVARQVDNDKRHVTKLEANVKAYLQAGDRETAAKFALELKKAKEEMAEKSGPARNARKGLRQQRDENQTSHRQGGRNQGEDEEVRRRTQDEPRRS